MVVTLPARPDQRAHPVDRDRLRRHVDARVDVRPRPPRSRRGRAGRSAGAARSSARSRCRPTGPPPPGRCRGRTPWTPRRGRRRGRARRCPRDEAPRRAAEGQRRLLIARHDLGRGPEPRGTPSGRRRRTRPRCAASRRRGRGGEAHPLGPERARTAPRTRATCASVRSIASGAMRPVRSTPWPSRTISIRRMDVGERPGRRVDVGDEQADRVGAAVDGRATRHVSRSALRRAVRRLGGGRPRRGRLPPVVEHAPAPRRRAG